ncbi:lytic transglycosylase domain-containing protein [Salmonella enterica]|nr:lytic transglycosylase domain-containing protein [Salmonella enterica]
MQTIPPGYHLVASESGVPAEALYSVSLAETSRKLPHGERPWPWTLNVAGKGYRYNTRQEAYDALLSFMRRYPLKRIDVGIAQVNLGWNGAYFSSYYEALEPYTNLRVAARILKSCYDSNPGSWIQAAGCYHHPAGGKPARTYKAIVKRKLATLDLSTPVSYSELKLARISTVTEPEVFRRTRNRFNQWLQTEFDRHYHTMRDGGYRSFLKKNHPTELERYDEACEALRREEFARFAELQTLGLYLHLQVQQKEAQFRRRRNRLLLGMTITGVMTSVLLYANFYPEQLQLISHELATLPGRISGFVGRLLH